MNSEPHIESWYETRWHQLSDEQRVQHTLSNSELYQQVKRWQAQVKTLNKNVK